MRTKIITHNHIKLLFHIHCFCMPLSHSSRCVRVCVCVFNIWGECCRDCYSIAFCIYYTLYWCAPCARILRDCECNQVLDKYLNTIVFRIFAQSSFVSVGTRSTWVDIQNYIYSIQFISQFILTNVFLLLKKFDGNIIKNLNE